MKNFYSFIYLDSNAIDTLYPQVFGDVIERNIVKSNEEIIGISSKLNMLNISGFNIESKENGISSESFKVVTSTFRKAQLLVDYFRGEYISIYDIISKNQPFQESIHFVGKATFFLSDIYDNSTGISLFKNIFDNTPFVCPNDNSIFVFEAGNTKFVKDCISQYIERDNYYEIYASDLNEYFGVMMHMSNLKISKDIRHISWGIKKGKHFEFNIFGELIKSSHQFYKISPFAIWQ